MLGRVNSAGRYVLLLCALLLLTVGVGTAQTNEPWQTNGNNIYYIAGNVGIGTTNPCSTPNGRAKLHVVDSPSGFPCTFPAAIYGEAGSDRVSGVMGLVSGKGSTAVFGFDAGPEGMAGTGVDGLSNYGTAVLGISVHGAYIFAGFDKTPDGDKRRFEVERATGNVKADGSFTSPADFAEMMTVTGSQSDYQPGDVLVIGPDGKLTLSTTPYATNLAGVYSARPGFVGDTLITERGLEAADTEQAQNRLPVALMGIVPVKVSAENGAILPGDLLTTSSLRGTAMKATDPKIGSILGKALEPLAQGTGVIKVLVMLR